MIGQKLGVNFIFFTIISCLAFLPSTAISQEKLVDSQTSKIIQNRDLSKYDNGGEYNDCKVSFVGQSLVECEESLVKARDFIWEHWKNKKKGYIVFKSFSIDYGFTRYLFIEPDKKGVWKVFQREEVFSSYRPPGQIDDLPDIFSIRRKRATKNDNRFKAGTIYLAFIWKDGKEFDYL